MTLDQLKGLGREDVLGALGLQTKRDDTSVLLPGLALFGVGLLVGAGVGLLLAPRPGRELRQDLSERIQNAPAAVAAAPQKIADSFQRASEQVAEKLGRKGDAPEANSA